MRKQRKEDQPITLSNLNLQFKNGRSTLSVSVNSNISAYEYVNDVLMRKVTVIKNKVREVFEVPVHNPVHVDIPRSDREVLRAAKADHRRLYGTTKFQNSQKIC